MNDYAMPALELLMSLGVAGATPFVVQWIYDLFPRADESRKEYLHRMRKFLTPVPVGAVISVLMALKTGEYTPELLYWIAFDGAIGGAVASSGVSLVGKLASKTGKVNVVNKS